MSDLNPYERFLDGRPLQEILAATPATLAGLLESIGPEKSSQPPAPAKWSAAENIPRAIAAEIPPYCAAHFS